jgi:ABC-type transporter Mla subunit MlaD
VKSLANQTAKATEEISAQISAVQNVTQNAVDAIKRIGGTIGEVSTVATSIASAVEEQGAATKEITRNTQETARRTKDVSDNVAGVASGADATGSAAQGVKSAAEALGVQTDRLRHQVTDFLGKTAPRKRRAQSLETTPRRGCGAGFSFQPRRSPRISARKRPRSAFERARTASSRPIR